MKTIRSKVMDYVEKNGPVSRMKIVKFVREACQGKLYIPSLHRGYYSSRFQKNVYTGDFMKPTKHDSRYFQQNKKKEYYVVQDKLELEFDIL